MGDHEIEYNTGVTMQKKNLKTAKKYSHNQQIL